MGNIDVNGLFVCAGPYADAIGNAFDRELADRVAARNDRLERCASWHGAVECELGVLARDEPSRLGFGRDRCGKSEQERCRQQHRPQGKGSSISSGHQFRLLFFGCAPNHTHVHARSYVQFDVRSTATARSLKRGPQPSARRRARLDEPGAESTETEGEKPGVRLPLARSNRCSIPSTDGVRESAGAVAHHRTDTL